MESAFPGMLPPRQWSEGVPLPGWWEATTRDRRLLTKVGGARMRPILFILPGGNFRIHGYGVMIFVACAAALAMAVWRSRREKVDPNAVYELATWLFLGGVIGARAFYLVQHPESFHSPSDLL